MDNLMGRMQVLADMRQAAEKNEFELWDYLRQLEVNSFRARESAPRKETRETKATLAEVLFQFRIEGCGLLHRVPQQESHPRRRMLFPSGFANLLLTLHLNS